MSRLNEAELGNARPEDVAWLSSLSDTELDMLISLKKLVIQRSKVTGYENLADKFDVKMLRALGVILLEYIRERVKNSSAFSSMPEASTILNECNLLRIMKAAEVQGTVARTGASLKRKRTR
eukprot:TRINITY_DN3127_c1_g1_i1.p1 TRINITY_DN3127_c1_g1~~TRINITY_DN3127_c1_g1_i1.p1  ORF type:complete len:122 (+),score=30.35 TRINITY_DN3127_c1_g1_i1:566-931(+)